MNYTQVLFSGLIFKKSGFPNKRFSWADEPLPFSPLPALDYTYTLRSSERQFAVLVM
ncbi:hypothetical protein OZ401_004769 (plasmid) [Candidatus Chlorohelix allophototropha]|uniref:Uncharacterized protein n=1 Tax=Candidatus Chlorohelix allophototropha TaxID=3003348 RepID=A0ABY9BAM4_9CHLR|nr:hypothetical protein OZ401_004769 [Chloroflexota bacterium L227-S17]